MRVAGVDVAGGRVAELGACRNRRGEDRDPGQVTGEREANQSHELGDAMPSRVDLRIALALNSCSQAQLEVANLRAVLVQLQPAFLAQLRRQLFVLALNRPQYRRPQRLEQLGARRLRLMRNEAEQVGERGGRILHHWRRLARPQERERCIGLVGDVPASVDARAKAADSGGAHGQLLVQRTRAAGAAKAGALQRTRTSEQPCHGKLVVVVVSDPHRREVFEHRGVSQSFDRQQSIPVRMQRPKMRDSARPPTARPMRAR